MFDFAALAQKGKYFYGGCVATGFAPDASMPTTTAKVGLVNVNGDGGESLIIDSVNLSLLSGTPAFGQTIIYGVSVGKIVSPPTANGTGFTIAPTRGKLANSGAYFQTTCTIPATAVWQNGPAASMTASADIGMGLGVQWDIGGKIIIPPGYAFHLGVFSAAGTTPKFNVSITWGEQLVTFAP